MSPSRQAETFAELYAEHVVPRLEREIQIEAAMLCLGERETWSDAVGRVWRIALRLGATSLPGPVFHDLEDWIDRSMLEEMLAADVRATRIEAARAREERDHPVRYWRKLVDGTSPENREAIERVAIAQSPRYRAEWRAKQGISIAQRRKLRGLA